MKKILTVLMLGAIIALMSGVASATPSTAVPDPGTTSSLVAIALGGMAVIRRFLR